MIGGLGGGSFGGMVGGVVLVQSFGGLVQATQER